MKLKLNNRTLKTNFNFIKLCKKNLHNRVTFIGLGNMGYPMAQNLIKSGIKVAGFDTNTQVTENFRNFGGCKFQTFESAIKESDAIITMLPNATIVEKIWSDAFNYAKKGTYMIDSSTISPIDAKNLAEKAHGKNFICADAPVSGGVMGAQNATLSFMVGTKNQDFEQISKYLSPMGKKIFYCGEHSSGQIAKICNNLCLGITMAGLSESLALGVKLGADPKVLSEIIGVSSGRCWSVDTYNPIPGVMEKVPSSRDYENGFSMDLITKDLNIALDCANKTELDLDLSKATQNYYTTIKNEGMNNKDFSYVFQYILNNKKIK